MQSLLVINDIRYVLRCIKRKGIAIFLLQCSIIFGVQTDGVESLKGLKVPNTPPNMPINGPWKTWETNQLSLTSKTNKPYVVSIGYLYYKISLPTNQLRSA
ncbi:hypothetical protein BDC45DRAFT_538707 [Circinella umbellata]|nr:hypothetical protein BDC45DRAFT_538707 [Circinella umbellata]